MHSRVVFNVNNRSINTQLASRVIVNTPIKSCLFAVLLRLRVIEVARVTPIGLCGLLFAECWRIDVVVPPCRP